jgi:rhodopsin domain-containing protein
MLVNTLPEGGLLAIHWCFCTGALAMLGGRLYVRVKTLGVLMADDYLMMAAWAVLLVNTILVSLQNHSTYEISKGFQGLIPPDQHFLDEGNIYVRYEFVSIGLFWTVTWLVKASFLAFYWKLLEGLFLYQKIWYGICVFAFLSYVGCWISSVLNCDPISDYWNFGTSTSCLRPVSKVA